VKLSKHQQGFTLVEIAVVLVIIGLLLGGVLKGQELIENAKIKSIANDMKAVQTAYNAYVDRYKAIPGDETDAVMSARGFVGSTGAPAGTAGNGVLDVSAAQVFTNGGEQPAFWRALRASGLITGDPAALGTVADLPKHSGGGLMGVGSVGGIYGQGGVSVCVAGLNAKQAGGIDALIDGSANNSVGVVRGDSSATPPLAPTAAAPNGSAYDESQVNNWTLCMKI